MPAPAAPWFNRSELLRGVEWWEAQGCTVTLGTGIDARRMYTAGDARTPADDLTALFADDEVDVVHCFQGGYGSAQTIPLIDWDVVRSNPKPFVGYSDITALHVAMRHFADLVTFYGPTLGDIAHAGVKTFNQERLLTALRTTTPLGTVPSNPDDGYLRSLAPGRASGELVGGCLWLLGQTIGAPWQPDLAGRLLFFEDVDCPPLVHGRPAQPDDPGRHAPRRRGRAGAVRLEPRAPRAATDAVDRGRARAVPGTAGCTGALWVAHGPRPLPDHHTTGGSGDDPRRRAFRSAR